MKLKSETLSYVLKTLLGVLLVLAVLDLAGSLVYAASESFYAEHLMDWNDKISLTLAVLYLAVIVIYLVWIYVVHGDLNRLIPDYPRSPGKSLACMLIPIYNFYGVPSTFMIMGNQAQAHAIHKEGKRISGLAFPLILLFFMKYASNRLINGNIDEPSSALYIFDGVVTVTMYAVFYSLTVSIAQALLQLNSRDKEENVLSR
ncbi:hypothetical protein [Paenibacillus silvisoli]|uniref:hypothetical protein n=1 Tax=Paenibacillus silvisoli TaxID=3110539 RepID=UPI002805828C|nr:hypothetical protein [Paenibacillus silvisoli]